jgi:DNA-directed RNA polymerase alpha subunit
MITKDEFLKALEIVNNYKIQVSEQFEEMKKDLDKKEFSHLAITKNTPINKTDLSVRALNALKANSDRYESLKNLRWDWNKCEITVGHFEVLKKSDLYGFRNIGKKSIDEIERMLFEAGIVLVG